MATKFLNISTDKTLGGNSPSDSTVFSQKAIKDYVDSQTGTAPSFANLTGSPDDNAALKSALDAKQATITGAASSVVTNNLAAARAVITDGSGKLAASSTTSTEIGYVSGVTSAIQTQLNNKQATLTAGNGIDITSNTISVGDIDCGTLS